MLCMHVSCGHKTIYPYISKAAREANDELAVYVSPCMFDSIFTFSVFLFIVCFVLLCFLFVCCVSCLTVVDVVFAPKNLSLREVCGERERGPIICVLFFFLMIYAKMVNNLC